MTCLIKNFGFNMPSITPLPGEQQLNAQRYYPIRCMVFLMMFSFIGFNQTAKAQTIVMRGDSNTGNVTATNLFISETYSAGSGNGTYAADWFEITNTGAAAVNISGWTMDDNSNAFASSVTLNGVTSIAAGQSVVFIEGDNTTVTKFNNEWFGGFPPIGFAIGTYSGSGVSLSTSGDAVNIYNGSGVLQTNVSFGTATTGNTFDNAASLNNTVISQLSAAGVNGGSISFNGTETGSPGAYMNTALPVVTLVATDAAAAEAAADPGTFRMARTGALNTPLTINYAITGSASNGVDYTPILTGTVTMAGGASFADITITPVDDIAFEGPETVVLTLNTNSNYTINQASAAITIADNDISNSFPTIVLAATTSDYIDGGATSIASPYAVSGVISDPTDPAAALGVDFTIADAETAVGNLTVTATSSNTNVLPNNNLTITGTGAFRNVKITPAAVGYSTVTVSVNDGANTSSYVLNYAASAASATASTTRFLAGTSDASTAQSVDANYMLVGDDENNILRLYNRQNSGLPVSGFDVAPNLGLTDAANPEVDIEASAQIGNRIYWMGSHDNSKTGKIRVNRYRIFATDISGSGAATTLSYIGRYDNLRTDLLNWDANNVHGLGADYFGLTASAAAGVVPEAAGGVGFNIEGLTIAPDNTTGYICFRAPIEPTTNRTKALIVPVTNFTTLAVSGAAAGATVFGTPIQLDLGGRGIREIKRNAANEYLIIAGPYDDVSTDYKLYKWSGNAADPAIPFNNDLTAISIDGGLESIVEMPVSVSAGNQVQILVDNGGAVYYNDAITAKDLTNNNHKKFRSEWVTLGALAANIFSGTGNWTDNARWSYGAPPAANNDIIIAAGAHATLNTNFTIGGSLMMNATSTLIINANRTLSISGIADFNGQSVTLSSNSAGTASLGQITGTLNGASNVTVERYLPVNATLGRTGKAWRLLTAPVTGPSVNTAWQGGSTWNGVTALSATGYATLINGGPAQSTANIANSNGFDWWSAVANAASSIRTFNSLGTGSWLTPANTTALNFVNNQGYLLYVRGDRSVSEAATGQATTLRATGTIKQGAFSLAIIPHASSIFTLIGNPYPSPINFESIYGNNSSKILNRFTIFSASLGQNGGYYLVERSSANKYTITPKPAGSSTYNTAAQFIQSGQAFFVEAKGNANNQKLSITESDKAAGGNASVFLQNEEGSTGKADTKMNATAVSVNINLSIKNADNSLLLADGALVSISNAYKKAVIAEDAIKTYNFSENLAVAVDTFRLISERRPALSKRDTIFLKLWGTGIRNYQLDITSSVLNGVTADLVDNFLHTSTPLQLNGSTNSYGFSITSNAGSKNINRFYIVTPGRAVTALKTGNLNESSATTNDGVISMKAYPNPATGKKVSVLITNLAKGSYALSVFNSKGQQLFTRTIQHTGGSLTEEIALNNWSAGVYTLQLMDSNGNLVKTISVIAGQ